MPIETDHHLITTGELKEQLSRVPDDSRLAFMADGVVFQFLGIGPDSRPGVEGVFAIDLRAHHNYPPVSP